MSAEKLTPEEWQKARDSKLQRGREPAKPIGHGNFCVGGLWMIDTVRDCPICGASRAGPCRYEKKDGE